MPNFRKLPRLPRLGSKASLPKEQPESPFEQPIPTVSVETRTTYQRRVPVSRRGPRQPDVGLSPDEQRAAQDIDAPLANRIAIKELRRLRVQFEFSAEGEPVAVSGLNVDFLVTDRSPLLVIDITTPQRPDDGWRRAVLTASGYRYEVIGADVLERDADAAETAIDDALGQLVGTSDRANPPDPRTLRAPLLPFGGRIWAGGDLDYDDVLDYDDEVEVVP